MAVSLCPTAGAFFQGFTSGGIPLNGGLIYTYIAGGTTPQATYTTTAGNVQNANPIVLNSDGRPPSEIWLTTGASYRFDLKDSLGTLIKTYDDIIGIQASSSGSFLPLAGGTMAGNIAMGGFKVTGLAAANTNGDAVRYEQSPAAILTGKGYLISATAANTPAVVTVGSNGQALVANSNLTNGLGWGSPALRSYLSGCQLSTAGGSATMAIAAGTAVDSTNVSAMILAATSKTTSAWAVGAGSGGLDTGAIANTTWYHFFVIQRVDTGVVDALISLSPNAPTMPANYTLFRRIGSGLTTGAAQWFAFTQDGDYFCWLASFLNVNSVNPGTAAITPTVSTPFGVNCHAVVNIGIIDSASSGQYMYLSDIAIADVAATAVNSQASSIATGQAGVAQVRVRTNTSSQIRYRLSASSATVTATMIAVAWFDTRGRDA